MCGRYVLTDRTRFFRKAPHIVPPDPALFPPGTLESRFNIAPMQTVIGIIRGKTADGALPFRWGLVPSWAKDESIGNRLINARAETLMEKPSFQRSLAQRRCLVPADAFYEWQKPPGGKGTKLPHALFVDGGEPFAFAGLWDTWRDPTDPDRPPLRTLTIITCEPNAVVKPLHHRMAVILPESAWEAWLDVAGHGPEDVQPLLRPFDTERMSTRRVSDRVNNVGEDDPGLLEPVDPEAAPIPSQPGLFG